MGGKGAVAADWIEGVVEIKSAAVTEKPIKYRHEQSKMKRHGR
jgi:hypothetical protein